MSSSSPFNDSQRQIVKALGRYFKVASDDRFLQLIVSGHGMDPEKMNADDFDPVPYAHKLATVFRNNLIGGATVYDAANFFKAATGDYEEKDPAKGETFTKTINTVYKFVGEPGDFGDKVGEGTSFSNVSIKEAMTPTGENKVINQKFTNPSKAEPNLTAVCINEITMTPSTQSTGTLALFLNCIPSIELAQAVPYLDVRVLSPVSARSESKKSVQGFGLYQFLKGGGAVEDGSVNAMLVDAVPSDVGTRNGVLDALWALEKDDDKQKEIKAQQKNSFAGMEVFLSPQTLVNADEIHQPLQDSGTRSASVIDRFRPFLTLESFNVETTNTRGMMTYRTGDLGFTLHDRSRLSEIAAFIKPDLYSVTELLITYGWSHPAGAFAGDVIDDTSGKLTGRLNHSLTGIFLDSMKVSEKYKVINSSFSFDDVGQVKVKLKLAMCAGEQLNTTTISKGDGVDSVLKTMKGLTDAIAEETRALKKVSASLSAKDATPDFSVLTTSSDTTSALMMDDEMKKKVAKFLRSSRSDKTLSSIRGNIVKLYGPKGDGKGGEVKKLRSNIATAVAKRMSAAFGARGKTNKDPFARTFTGTRSPSFVNIKAGDTQYVSLGLLLMQFVGLPLAATNDYDEVQFIFYPFNDRAGYVRDANIAQFPISKKNFEREFAKMTRTTANITLAQFVGFLNKNFVGSQKADVWGLRDLYKTKDGEFVLKTRFRYGLNMYDSVLQHPEKKIINLQDSATVVANLKKMRLADAYGEDGDQTFMFPRIRMELETVKLASESKEDQTPGGGTVLRIKLYDARATPYTCLNEIIGKSRAGAINAITKSGREAIRDQKKINDKLPEKNGQEDTEHASNTGAMREFTKLINKAVGAGILEATPSPDVDTAGTDPNTIAGTTFKIKGGFPQIKKFVTDTMPTLHYGTSTSGIISADVSSQQSSRLNTINIVDSTLGDGMTAQGARDTGLPLQVAPVELALTTIGAPCAQFGQHFFVDFGTGTTVDNVYIVTSVAHEIGPGKFETKLKLNFDSTFGTYHNMMGILQEALMTLDKPKK